MKIRVYNAKMGKFDTAWFTCPSFVKNEGKFAEMVEAEHVLTTMNSLKEKYANTFAKAHKDNATEEQIVACQNAEHDLRRFESAFNSTFPANEDGTANAIFSIDSDLISCMFCIAFGLEKGSIDTKSFNIIFSDTRTYNNLFYTMQNWTPARKQSFKELKEKTSAYIDALFSLKEENDMYLKRTLSLNSKDVQMYLDKSAPTLKKTKVKNQFGDISGIAETEGSAKTCLTFLFQTVFFHNGCAVTQTKKQAHLNF